MITKQTKHFIFTISFFITCCIFGILRFTDSSTILAWTDEVTDGTVKFQMNYDNWTMTVSSATGSAVDMKDYDYTYNRPWDKFKNMNGDLVIDRSIKSIGKNAFADFSSIQKVTFNGGVTSIGENAFKNAGTFDEINLNRIDANQKLVIKKGAFEKGTFLAKVILPMQVTIEEGAFRDCQFLSTVKKVEGYPGCITVGKEAFQNCSLNTVPWSQELKEIGDGAFKSCIRLTSFAFSDKISKIGNDAFEGCGLNEISIPKSVKYIGDYAFKSNPFTAAYIYTKDAEFGEDILEKSAKRKVYCYKGSTADTYFKQLGFEVFYLEESSSTGQGSTSSDKKDCRYGIWKYDVIGGEAILTECLGSGAVEIPTYINYNKVKGFTEKTFQGKKDITSVVIIAPSSITSAKKEIPGHAFENCTGLKSVTLSKEYCTIGENAFSGCTALETITIPDSVTNVGGHAFENCTSLKNVTWSANAKEIKNSTFKNCTSLNYITNIKSVEIIEDYAFYSVALNSITFPSTLKNVGKYAFSKTPLKRADLMARLETLSDYAFYDCPKLERLVIAYANELGQSICGNSSDSSYAYKTNVYYLGSFYKLKESTFASPVNLYLREANINNLDLTFAKNASHKVITYYQNTNREVVISGVYPIEEELYVDGDFFYTENGQMLSCEKITLAENFMKNNIVIKNVYLPSQLTHIGKYAFNGCRNIQYIQLGAEIKDISDYAFCGCYNMRMYAPKGLPKLETIGAHAFEMNAIKDLDLFKNAKKIGDQAFVCNGADTYVMSSNLQELGTYVFVNTSFKKVVWSASVKEIPMGTFYQSGIGELIIPEGVTRIEDLAFAYCRNLKKLFIPKSVTYLADSAFNGVTDITIVTENPQVIDYCIHHSIPYEAPSK